METKLQTTNKLLLLIASLILAYAQATISFAGGRPIESTSAFTKILESCRKDIYGN